MTIVLRFVSSATVRLEPESNLAFRTLRYEMKDYRHIVNQALYRHSRACLHTHRAMDERNQADRQ